MTMYLLASKCNLLGKGGDGSECRRRRLRFGGGALDLSWRPIAAGRPGVHRAMLDVLRRYPALDGSAHASAFGDPHRARAVRHPRSPDPLLVTPVIALHAYAQQSAIEAVAAWLLALLWTSPLALARFRFPGRELAFALVLLQLMILPDVLVVENFRTLTSASLTDTVVAIATPYFGWAFGIFFMRQTFRGVTIELHEAARMERAGPLAILRGVYLPLARPAFLAYGLVSVSFQWNNLLWPLIVTKSVQPRPLTVGLQIFTSGDQGIDWSVITAATLLSVGALLIAFVLFQRQFVQSFLRAGIR